MARKARARVAGVRENPRPPSAKGVSKYDPVKEIAQHLDKSDPILLILRAHLLIEERLRAILAQSSRAPDELRAARLSFYQVLQLCRALLARYDEPAWDFMARLNEARNRIAHQLDPGNLDEILGELAERLQSDYSKDRLRTPLDRFQTSTVFTCGYLDAIKGSVRLRKAYADENEV
jgi:hypothetical protein